MCLLHPGHEAKCGVLSDFWKQRASPPTSKIKMLDKNVKSFFFKAIKSWQDDKKWPGHIGKESKNPERKGMAEATLPWGHWPRLTQGQHKGTVSQIKGGGGTADAADMGKNMMKTFMPSRFETVGEVDKSPEKYSSPILPKKKKKVLQLI